MAVARSTPAARACSRRSRKLPRRRATRSPKRARRSRARASASGSWSMPSRRVSAPPASNSRSACPPMPIVPSTTQPPCRGRKRNVTSSARTGRCAPSRSTLDALFGQLRLDVLDGRPDLVALVVREALAVPHLEALLHADDEGVLGQTLALAQIKRDLDSPLRIENHVLRLREILVLKCAPERIEPRQTTHAIGEFVEVPFGVHVEAATSIGNDDELVSKSVGEQLPEFRGNAESPLRIHRVSEMSPKHALPLGEKPLPGLYIDTTSWDFIPLADQSKACKIGCQAKTPISLLHPGHSRGTTGGGRRRRSYRIWETGGSARLVVLHRLRHPRFDLRDAGCLGRVRREELGGLARSLGGQLGHADPEVPRRVWVIAGLGHEDETEVIGL